MISRKRPVVITSPAFNQGDGVGHDVEGMAKTLLAAGHPVYVFSEHYAPSLETWRCDESTIRGLLQSPETILIHHHSINCALLQDLLASAASRIRVMRYHNVTPPEFFVDYDGSWVKHTREGRLATVEVARRCTHFLVPSLYNARDLIHAGADVDRLFYQPYFHKLGDFDSVADDPHVAQKLQADTRLKVLFLGRRVPNKGHLHLVRTIGEYKRLFDSQIVLYLVGGSDPSLARYDDEIREEIRRMGLEGEVELHEKVSFAGIAAYYRGSDVFLCLSQHEGFCIPIIEAEYCGLPVVAHYRRGVPEALGPTQPWSTALDYRTFAEHLRDLRVRPDEAMRLGEAGAASVRRRFDLDSLRQRFLGWFAELDNAVPAMPVKSSRLRVAFVVQRFSPDVSGGAEAIARMFAAQCSNDLDITVVTTNSKTLDWDSSFRLSEDLVQQNAAGYRTVRLPSERRRSWADFDQATREVFQDQIDTGTWFRRHGPDAPMIADYLSANIDSFDLIVNWTYLFSNAYYVSRLAGRVPIVAVPFFHDELWLRVPGMAEVVDAYDAYIYQTEAERALGEAHFDLDRKPAIVLGSGIEEEAAEAASASYRGAAAVHSDTPYIVYVGRVERPKGVHTLIENFQSYKKHRPGPLKLRIIGRAHDFEVPDDPDIEHLGFLSEAEKFRTIAASVCLVNPSALESFSLVLLESWAVGRPVLVNGRCAAMRSQVSQSGGGLAYDNYREFEWALDRLSSDSSTAATLGENGYTFYTRRYRWQKVVPRFVEFLTKVLRLGGARSQAKHPAPGEAPRAALAES